MLLILQITCTILSAIFVASFIPVGVWLGWAWAIACALLAGLFFLLMLLCKQSVQMKEAQKENQNTSKTEEQE